MHLGVQRQQGGGVPEPHDIDVGPDDVEAAAHDLGDDGATGPGGAPPVGVPPAEGGCGGGVEAKVTDGTGL